MPLQPTDADLPLLRSIAAGNSDALQQLYDRHGLSLLNTLIALLGDRQTAEDVLQDVMLAVWKQAAAFRGESSVKTWMFAIARRQSFKTLQRSRRVSSPLDENITGSSPDYDGYVDLIAAINRLPADQQEALDLIFYRGMSGQEAADYLKISLNTFKSRLFRARQNLTALMENSDAPR